MIYKPNSIVAPHRDIADALSLQLLCFSFHNILTLNLVALDYRILIEPETNKISALISTTVRLYRLKPKDFNSAGQMGIST